MGCRYLIKFEWQCANFQCGTQEQNQMMTQTKTIHLNVEAVDALQELSRALFHKNSAVNQDQTIHLSSIRTLRLRNACPKKSISSSLQRNLIDQFNAALCSVPPPEPQSRRDETTCSRGRKPPVD
jgi:hypothetical protein